MREFCTKWWKRIATVDMLFIGVLTLLASLFASWLKQFPGFSLFGALIGSARVFAHFGLRPSPWR